MRRYILSALLLFAGFFGLLTAQDPMRIQFAAELKPEAVSPGGTATLLLHVDIPSDFHISTPESGFFSVKTGPESVLLPGEILFPPGEKDSFGMVYRGKLDIEIPVTVKQNVSPGEKTEKLIVTYQPCYEAREICYPPQDKEESFTFHILPGSSMAGSGSTAGDSTIAGRLEQALARGSFIAFLLVFAGGLLTSLTPCVYPMIPITVAVIGAQATGNKLKGFVLSLFYVLGIALTFSILGMIAAKTGGIFGAYVQHPVVIVLVAMIFLLMGLSMLGAFVIQMPPALASKLRGKKRTGFVGAFITGMAAGLIVSPCISPLLVVILTWVARTGSVLLGFGLLFSFALGLGILFILIGTFSGILKNLPKTGGWAEWIERGFGLLLLTLAIVFVRPVLPHDVYLGLWAVYLMLCGVFFGGLTPLTSESGRSRKTGKAIGLLLIVISASLVFSLTTRRINGQGIPIIQQRGSTESANADFWLSSEREALVHARENKKPVLLDFYAEWCAACRELDEKTWPDAEVRKALKQFIPVKLDLTRENDVSRDLRKKYRVMGMPTVLVLSPEGRELGRFEGYMPPDQVIRFLQQWIS